MRHGMWWIATAAALAVVGCGRADSTLPVSPAGLTPLPSTSPTAAPVGSVDASLGSPALADDLSTSALAIYTVEVNPSTLTATSRLKETRSGQANDDLYLLSIDSFLNAGSFKITGVAADTENIQLNYTVTHPFPAPSDPTGTPNGSTNRADLGIAGMVLFLADVPSATGNTYFTDRVANTALVSNADAYYSPGGLITAGGTANTFPYLQLVDEVADSRDISNGGDVTGNFGSDGWTRSEFGAGNNGWTGYGVLHQGQASSNTVSFDKDALSGGFSLDVAIIAKYNDPRGGATPAQKKANRLPPAAADAASFAYRMPHGALDGAKIIVEDEPAGFVANTISAAQVSIHVEDWDARATETTEADLSDDASFTNVAVGESGTPSVDICIPDVLGGPSTTAIVAPVVDDDTAYGGDAAPDSGRGGDALFYSGLVTKIAGSGQVAGDFTGMVRVTDPEAGLVIGLDESLAPLPTPPAAVTYQAFTVTQLPDNTPPSATVALSSSDPLNSGTAASVAITSIADPDSDPLDISVDWGNGAGFIVVVNNLPAPYANQTPSSPNMNNADLIPDTINVVVRVDDGTVQVDYPLSYTLGPNRPPQVTGNRVLANPSVAPPATFTMNAGTGTAIDPEGDAVSYTITNSVNSDQPSFATFPNVANMTPIAVIGPVVFTVYANDALHPTTGGTAYPAVNGTVAIPLGWARKPPGSTSSEGGYAVATTGTGVLLMTSYYGTQDFGGGNRTSQGLADVAVIKYDIDGNYVWDYVCGSVVSSETVQDITADAAGNIWLSLYTSSPIDFGGGLRTPVSTDSFLVKLNSAGVYQTDVTITGASFDYVYKIDTDASNNLVASGYYGSDPITIGGVLGVNSNGNAAWVAKFNSAGTVQWTKFYDGTAALSDYAYAVSFDPAGNVYVGAQSWNTSGTGPNYGGGPLLAVSTPDSYAIKYDSAGTYQWLSVVGVGGSEYIYASTANGSAAYMAGYFSGTSDFGTGPKVAVSSDIFVVSYNPASGAANWNWTNLGSSTTDYSRGVALDASGNVFVAGYAGTGIDFGGGARTSAGGNDAYIVKLNSSGVWQWDHFFGGSTTDYCWDTDVDSNGDVVASGYFQNTADFQPGVGVFNMTSAGSLDPFVIKVDGPTGGW